MFESGFFTGNRVALRGKLPPGALILITANGLLQRSGDTTFPFRQDSNFYYLTGLGDLPDAVLVMAGDEEFLILPKRSKAEVIFGGAINCDDIASKSGIIRIYSYKEGWERYKKLLKSRKTVYTLGNAPSKVSGIDSFYTNPARKYLIQKIKRLADEITIEDLRSELMKLRMIKQPEEIEAIQWAIAITQKGFEAARKIIKPGAKECDIAAEFEYIFTKQQANHGYHPIIASGEHACVLHYTQNNDSLQSGAYVLIDVGAEYGGYSADITRTYPVGEMGERPYEIYGAVETVQRRAIKLLKAGLAWRDYAVGVDEIMGEELIRLGLIKQNTRTEIRKYFPHGISHSLGLDVHDVCDYDVLQENMVITVEPGIYIPEEGIGVRIEDDVLITKNGAVNLSGDIPY